MFTFRASYFVGPSATSLSCWHSLRPRSIAHLLHTFIIILSNTIGLCSDQGLICSFSGFSENSWPVIIIAIKWNGTIVNGFMPRAGFVFGTAWNTRPYCLKYVIDIPPPSSCPPSSSTRICCFSFRNILAYL